MTAQMMEAPTGWCLSGHHGPHEHCTGCPGVIGGQTYTDPARKGATFTTPERLCPCWCHTRNLNWKESIPMSNTEYVVFCPAHQHYLVRVTALGTTWSDDPDRAERYPTKPKAHKAAEKATWLTHNPTPWAVPANSAVL